jgi:hypothetical protein
MGVSNSWIQQYTDQPSPCIADTSSGSSSIGSCILWFVVGIVIGSLSFEKKYKGELK